MTSDADSMDEWILVLEYQPRPAGQEIERRTVHALVEELQAWRPSALHSPDRYALQLHLVALRPSDALRRGLGLHDQAVATLGVPAPVLVRAEVMTAVEFESQWDEPGPRSSSPTPVETLLSDDVYRATRAMLRATTAAELTDILARFVIAAGGRVQAGPDTLGGQVTFDISLEGGERSHAVVDGFSMPAVIIEHSLPILVADARSVLARLRQPRPVAEQGQPSPRCRWRTSRARTSLEHMFEAHCLDCPTDVTFETRPGDTVCPGCGLRLYVTAEGQLGRYVSDDWRPGGIQGYRRHEP